jgi:hypothetical protein
MPRSSERGSASGQGRDACPFTLRHVVEPASCSKVRAINRYDLMDIMFVVASTEAVQGWLIGVGQSHSGHASEHGRQEEVCPVNR